LPFPFFAADAACFPGGRRRSAKDTLALADTVVRGALAQAKLPEASLGRAGIVLGTTAGSALHFLDAYTASRAQFPRTSPDREDYFAANLALEQDIPAHGPRMTITNACTSGADAIGLALDMIRTGQCECVVCGGADALSLVPHTGFARLMIYDHTPCRPFDRTRKGLNLGEGAAALVLESVEHAHGRNAAILGYILGYGSAADAYHFTAPHPEGRGLAASIRIALENAGLHAADMAFVNAHGTATPENDKVEGRLLAKLLPATPVWASKGGTGHTLGAAGALEAVLALQSLNRGRIPATLGFQTPDPDIGLIPTQDVLVVDSPYALSTSLGFGGGNAALLLGRGDV
jgi:3-oxoacyl-[acyl-carrier-protein] synthase-1/3-oxoacyl-[acyl-carrier-protein] synthase II